MAFLELRGVGKGFGKGAARMEVLANIDLQVARGELVAIVGYSGAGKTTLVSLMAGLTAPDHGSIRLAGEPVTGPGADRGVVFQNYSLLPWLTAYENVYLAVDQRFGDWSKEQEARARGAAPGAGEPGGGARQAAVRAVGRHAPARGAGARAGDGSRGAADGRAAVGAGRADAGDVAGRDRAHLGGEQEDGRARSPTTSTRRCCSPTASSRCRSGRRRRWVRRWRCPSRGRAIARR